MVSSLPDPGPRWVGREIKPNHGTLVEGSIATLFYRNPIKLVQELLQRPSLAESLDYTPTRVYANEEKTKRVYSEMSSGDWWWRTQVSKYLRTGVHC
jgi:hypothetical protein